MNSWSAPSELPGDTALPVDTSPELRRFADAVLNEGKSLLLVRSDPSALSRISQSLQAHWVARSPQLLVEHFSGRLSAGLLGLINATLADQALAVVMRANALETPKHLCVVHDAECLSQDELLLLQRVIEHFPGWDTRLVLLFNTTLDTSEKLDILLQQPGKGLMIWQLHTQPPARGWVQPNHSLKPWIAGLGSLLLLGAAVTGLRAPSHMPANLDKSTAATASQTLLPSSAPETGTPAKADPPVPAQAALAAPPESSQASTLPLNSTRSSAQPTTAALPTVPDTAARGHRWLLAQPKDFFVVIHSSHEQLQQAQRATQTRPELSNARLLMVSVAAAQPEQFVVVTGPFRSEERAQNYKLRQKLPASARIESVNTVLLKSRSGSKAKP